MVGPKSNIHEHGSTARSAQDAAGLLLPTPLDRPAAPLPAPADLMPGRVSDLVTASPRDVLETARMHRLRLVGLEDEAPTGHSSSLANTNRGTHLSRDGRDSRQSSSAFSARASLPSRTPTNIRQLSAGRIPAKALRSPAPTASASAEAGPAMGEPIRDAADPRWVLAVRTAESLEGTVLRPEKRERLVHMGKILGLSPFDANLVIAIVQDQARRGFAPSYCPTAGESQLRLVPLPHRELSEADASARRILIISLIITVLIGFELIILKWIFS